MLLTDSARFRSSSSLLQAKSRTMRHAGKRTGLASLKSGGSTQLGFRHWQALHVDLKAGATLRYGVWNGWVNSSTGVPEGLGGAMTIRIAVDFPGASRTADFTATIADNGIGYVDITVPVDVLAHTRFKVHGDIDMAGAGRIAYMNWSNTCDRGNGDEFITQAAGYGHTQDNTVLGANEVGNWLPQFVSVLSDRKVAVAIGSSSVAGVNDLFFDPTGGRGVFGRPLGAMMPFINLGVNGWRADQLAANYTKIMDLLVAAGCDISDPKAFVLYNDIGRNDISNSRTATQLLADRNTINAAARAVGVFKIIETTLPPHTTSTDVFVTTANQTASNAAQTTVRHSFNEVKRGNFMYNCTGTLTNGSAVITAISPLLTLMGLFVGMTITSGTSGVPGGTTIASIDIAAGTVTMSANFTGTTTVGAAITGTSPSVTGSNTHDALVDLAGGVECAKTLAVGLVRNGGVWDPVVVDKDGLHRNPAGYEREFGPINRMARSV